MSLPVNPISNLTDFAITLTPQPISCDTAFGVKTTWDRGFMGFASFTIDVGASRKV